MIHHYLDVAMVTAKSIFKVLKTFYNPNTVRKTDKPSLHLLCCFGESLGNRQLSRFRRDGTGYSLVTRCDTRVKLFFIAPSVSSILPALIELFACSVMDIILCLQQYTRIEFCPQEYCSKQVKKKALLRQ